MAGTTSSTRYLDTMRTAHDGDPVSRPGTRPELLLDPVLVPDLTHAGVGTEAARRTQFAASSAQESGGSPAAASGTGTLFYPNGKASQSLRSNIREQLRVSTDVPAPGSTISTAKRRKSPPKRRKPPAPGRAPTGTTHKREAYAAIREARATGQRLALLCKSG